MSLRKFIGWTLILLLLVLILGGGWCYWKFEKIFNFDARDPAGKLAIAQAILRFTPPPEMGVEFAGELLGLSTVRLRWASDTLELVKFPEPGNFSQFKIQFNQPGQTVDIQTLMKSLLSLPAADRIPAPILERLQEYPTITPRRFFETTLDKLSGTLEGVVCEARRDDETAETPLFGILRFSGLQPQCFLALSTTIRRDSREWEDFLKTIGPP